MQAGQEMRAFPMRAIGLALALLVALLLAAAGGYALRGAVSFSPADVSTPKAGSGHIQALPPELTGPTGPTDADALGQAETRGVQSADAKDRNQAVEPQGPDSDVYGHASAGGLLAIP